MPTRTIRCPAKLNLTLAVGPPDPSDAGRGRHPVASLMIALDFGDALAIEALPTDTERSVWSRGWADDAPHATPIDWPLDQDLLVQAHAAVEQAAGVSIPVEAHLEKRVPPGTGLGGGSGDAAAMLRFLETHLAETTTASTLDVDRIAAELGADVSFALHALRHPDQPAAFATGFGEQLEPFTLPNPLHAALILPDFGCPTGPVYAAFDRLHPDANPVDPEPTRRMIEALQRGARLTDVDPFNDLTDAAVAVQPGLRALFQALRDADLDPQLTGSGAAIFIPARDASEAKQFADVAQRVVGHPALAIQTLS
ncbi:MAG: hypothetical protein AAGH92_10705 [Planctomycetota bacterium]